VTTFAYCYGRIFHTISRHSKVVSGHAGRIQDVPMAITLRDPNAGQIQQQATGTATGAKISVVRTTFALFHTQLSCYMVLRSMVKVLDVLLTR